MTIPLIGGKKKPVEISPKQKIHECTICGKGFLSADELSAHLTSHKELFDAVAGKDGAEMRDLGETLNLTDYLNYQYTEATASDLETLVQTEAGIRAWGRKGAFDGMKWVGILMGGGIGLVIIIYLMMELIPGLGGIFGV